MARFRTKARAVDLLGKQQIRDEITAISELMRNSYDADASEGIIDVDTRRKRIVVWDDGDGMGIKDISENWLTIGTYSKNVNKIIPTTKGRVKIGEKGIGRLAISLLGDQLLIVSRKRGSNEWSLLYLHWELFRNEKLYLEDIELPSRSFKSLEETTLFLKESLSQLKEELLRNLDLKDNWEADKLQVITEQIRNFYITEDVYTRLRINESRNGGTLFYIHNMEYEWNWTLYTTSFEEIEDDSQKERRRRMQNVLVSFTNLIDLFDKELNGEENHVEEESGKEFQPRIHIDGVQLENEGWFNDDDIQLFDYALKGTINNGRFFGQAVIKNANTIETHEIINQDLNKGIHYNNQVKIGPVKVKWFFVEGSKKQSSLTPEQHEMMTKKLEDSGGLFVFRDGLRILPYGEPGNDFLKIEERRSRGAGYYLFSHRRMYGYMEISKMENPQLIDKSSREGFIQNKAYDYFCATAINLLKWWAIDFLESVDKNGLRGVRNKRLQQEREKEQKARKQRQEEENNEKKYFNDLHNYLKEMPQLIAKTREEIQQSMTYVLQDVQDGIKRHNNNIAVIDRINQANLELNTFSNNILGLKVTGNMRYSHPADLLDNIDEINQIIEKNHAELIELANKYISNLNELSREITSDMSERGNSIVLKENIREALAWSNGTIESRFKRLQEEQLGLLKSDFHGVFNKIMEIVEEEVERKVNEYAKPLLKEVREKAINLENIVMNLDTNNEDLAITFIGKAEQELANFKELMDRANNELLGFPDYLAGLDVQIQARILLNQIRDKLLTELKFVSDDNLIGLLKKEVTMYRELSAVGLAAELTSHEFNALYSGIQQNLALLQRSLGQTRLLPVIEKTRSAFRSLERLHQKMNPFYRQVRSRKSDIMLTHFINSVVDYFKTDIEKYGVKIHVQVDESIYIRENEAILFTPLVNLLSNAIYWVLSGERREIYFYCSMEDRILYIHDTGPGITKKDKARIFDPFFSRKNEGRGLGLYLSRDILESRGHKIDLVEPGHEIYPYGGACFYIEFSRESFGGDMK
ncbi:sensor histidine kinase [Paenibacillus ihbetae]|uniref:histidine kinase n=1 Tax=Paenibacillus ihbetae TaxID=1870820 RepID=A0ABX3JPG8_9BACL|nr:sensor histidine kinase [Paenibacillus ihbetae]OOC58735.1 hypothetical protein BBD40_23955 [Paenibacillus ihbetae]